MSALDQRAYSKPTPIQQQSIPVILQARDVIAAAQTGTGKTLAFSLPVLQNLSLGQSAHSNQVRSLILVPTRELAQQVAQMIEYYARYLSLRTAVVFGGVKINPQMMALRKGVDLLVATPGRLIDLYHKNAMGFDRLEILVLDEADRMLDLGFSQEMEKIIAWLPRHRQNLLFSATLSNTIRQLAHEWFNKPLEIDVSPRNSTVKKVKQIVYEVDKAKKASLLRYMLRHNDWHSILVFVKTKKGADQLVRKLIKDKFTALAYHGDKSQSARNRALSDFKATKIRVLVATDLASRGIDVLGLPCVINFDLPKVPEDYIHRIGRTGRAGCIGLAISLVSADEVKYLSDIENLIQKLLSRESELGFEPTHQVPLTQLRMGGRKPKKLKKPKKPKK